MEDVWTASLLGEFGLWKITEWKPTSGCYLVILIEPCPDYQFLTIPPWVISHVYLSFVFNPRQDVSLLKNKSLRDKLEPVGGHTARKVQYHCWGQRVLLDSFFPFLHSNHSTVPMVLPISAILYDTDYIRMHCSILILWKKYGHIKCLQLLRDTDPSFSDCLHGAVKISCFFILCSSYLIYIMRSNVFYIHYFHLQGACLKL